MPLALRLLSVQATRCDMCEGIGFCVEQWSQQSEGLDSVRSTYVMVLFGRSTAFAMSSCYGLAIIISWIIPMVVPVIVIVNAGDGKGDCYFRPFSLCGVDFQGVKALNGPRRREVAGSNRRKINYDSTITIYALVNSRSLIRVLRIV